MEIFDLHSDVLTATNNPYEVLKSYSSNVTVCTAIYKGNLTDNQFILKVNEFYKNNPINAKLCFEDVGYDKICDDQIISYNPLYVQLTYNDENKYGYGCNYNLPLKKLGVNFVKKLYKNGIYVDLAHLSKRGALSVLENTNKVICSHTLFKKVYNHKRNIDEDVIKGVINCGGVIGACLVGYFAGESKSLGEFVNNVDYFIQKFEDNNLAIGTDFFGTDIFIGDVDNYDKFEVIINAILNKGYSKSTLQKILYKNAKKILK